MFGKVLTAIRDNEIPRPGPGLQHGDVQDFRLRAGRRPWRDWRALSTSSASSTRRAGVLDIAFSIEVVILVAVGGRGTLFGPILGAILVNF